MKINPLLVVTAVLYAIGGLGLLFASSEILGIAGVPPLSHVTWLSQLLAGALLGLAWLNWLQRFAVIGGILGRPILLANLMFTTVGFFGTVSVWRHEERGTLIVVTAIVLGVLWLLFGVRLFSSRRAPDQDDQP